MRSIHRGVIRFEVPRSGHVIAFRPEVTAHLAAKRQMHIWQREAGGQLFATFEGGDTVIRLATGPRALDRRTRYGFVPDRMTERREIREQHAAGLHFVGDWHTHPQTLPVPSPRDLASMTECVRRSEHALAGFLLVVVGRAAAPDGMYVALCAGSFHERLRCIAEAS